MNNAKKIDQASALIKNNLFLEAKKLLKSVVLKDSCQVDALYLLALAESNLNNLTGANAYLSSAGPGSLRRSLPESADPTKAR